MSEVTRELAVFVAESRWSGVPQAVRHEAARAMVNWLGCAIAGCRDEAVERLVATLRDFSGAPQATLLGRGERFDALTTACVNAVASNVLDFDDTHLRTVIHPTVPVAPALLALAEHRALSGAEFVHAFVLGVDAECRIGNAISPEHYEKGWHITATCGVIGAAVACAKALKLDVRQTAHAIGIASTQASGLTSMLGTMSKCYNMGHAARNGLTAALLAERGFTSSERALEAPRGFLNVLSPRCDSAEVTADLRSRWELLANAYKPYPCGIVIHPVIDACLDLRAAHAIEAAHIASVNIVVNPLAQKLCGNPAPRNGLEAKLSLHHSAAVALLEGSAGVAAYEDAKVRDPRVLALRAKVALSTDPAVAKEQARVRVLLADGVQHELFVERARGSLERPMTDAELDAKFRSLAAAELAPGGIERLAEQCWMLERLPDAGALARGSAA